MVYAPSRLVETAWATQPSCLRNFKATPVRQPTALLSTFDDLGYFHLACTCGNDVFRTLGHPQPGGFVACPLVLECTRCRKADEVFDIRKHGYDAALGHESSGIVGDGEKSLVQCKSCRAEEFGVNVGLSYQIAPIEDLPANAQAFAQDLFDWFYLEGNCTKCGTRVGISDYECA